MNKRCLLPSFLALAVYLSAATATAATPKPPAKSAAATTPGQQAAATQPAKPERPGKRAVASAARS